MKFYCNIGTTLTEFVKFFRFYQSIFYCFNHQILSNTQEHHGLKGNTLKLLSSCLNSRKQYTVYSDFYSLKQSFVSIDVPQGSVLGPFLLLVFDNVLLNVCNSDTILYADDAILFSPDRNIENLPFESEKNFQNGKNWIELNELNEIEFYCIKTNCLLFSNRLYLSNFNVNSTSNCSIETKKW